MKKYFNIEISCLSIIVIFYLELNKENKIKWFELIIQYLVNYSMNLKRELMNSILLISQYLTQVYIGEIINIIDKNEISNRVSQIEQYNRIIGEFEEKKKNISSENKSKSGIFGAFINVIGSNKNKNETSESNKLDEEKIAETKKKLSDVLSEECVLCGDYMVDSTQCPFVRDEKIEWDLDNN